MSFYACAEKDGADARRGITFDLNTGNELTFQDAFVRNANVKPLLADAIYTRLVTWRGERTYWSIQEDNKAEFDYDGETLKILNRVDFSKTDNFFLSPNSISFIVDNSIYEIKAKDHIKYFGYYDAYASSESLFNNGDGLKNIPLTNTYSNSLSYNVFDETETGTYTFEIINYYSWIENDLQLNQKLGEYYRKKMPKSDAYIVLQVGGRIRDGEEDSPLKLFTGDYVFCKMSKTDYQNTFRKKIFDAKKPTGVAMLDWIAAIDVNYGCDEKISSDPLIIDAENNLHKLSDAIKDEYFTDTYCPLLSQNKQADCRKNFDKYYTHEYSYETFIITERDNTENVSSVFIPDEIPREYFNDNVKF